MYRAQAIYQFDGAVPTDLPLKEGEIVTIIGKLPGNLWWEGESADGRIGTFPYNYVIELPPEDEFREFVGKTGISNFDIIQFVTNDNDTYQGKSSVLCHVICGDGEYIMEMVHEDFINLDLFIKERFPLLELPSLPSVDTQRSIYKKLIYDYFAYFGIHQMVTPVILKWLQSIPKTCVSPCPHWEVYIHTTNIISEEEAEVGGKSLISVTRDERYILLDIEDDLLLLENKKQQGWCHLRYCEIEWMDHSKDDDHSQLSRIIPFSLPSIQCSEDLRMNHISMQTLHMSNRSGVSPTIGDTVILRVHLYIWNSLRGYMYQFYNTNKNPLYHVIGSNDCSIITELIDHKIQLMHEGEKTMIILHSSTDAPKEVISFLEGCISFYLCYILDLRVVKKAGNEQILPNMILLANKSNQPVIPVRPEKPAKPTYLYRNLAYSLDVSTVREEDDDDDEGKVEDMKEEEKNIQEEVEMIPTEEVRISHSAEIKEMPVEDVSTEVITEVVPTEDVPTEVITEVIHTEDVPIEVHTEDVSTEVTHTEVVPTEDVPIEVHTEVTHTEDVPTEDVPVKATPTEVVPTEVVPVKVTPTEIMKEEKQKVSEDVNSPDKGKFAPSSPSVTHTPSLPSSPSTRPKPILPPKPPKEFLSTNKPNQPELPPKPPHINKLSHVSNVKPLPSKPAKPPKPSKSKPIKPVKPKGISFSLSSNDSHDTLPTSGQSQFSMSSESVQSPVTEE